jgi:hypothetical protein
MRFVRAISVVSLVLFLVTGCTTSESYDSEALRRLAPIVEQDRAAAQTGSPLSLAAVRDAADALGMTTSIGASRGVENLSVETVNGGGVQRVFAVLDGEDCLFGVVDTGARPVAVYWVLAEDVYTATDIVPSGTCAASAYFGIDVSGAELSTEQTSPTRLS